MPFNALSILNGAVDASGAGGAIRNAIANASRTTGVDFNYLLGQAKLESGLNANAKAGTSSAIGLYQFVEQSWLRVVKAHGAEHGLGWAADAITLSANGRANVSDPATRRAILDLRKDPATASLMAAEHASDNKDAIESALGRGATGTDLYMAHFLGLGGARSFLGALQATPDRSAAALFPAAARANHNIFYDANGAARSLGDIYNRFAAKLDKGAGGSPGVASGGFGLIPAVATTLDSTRLGAWGADVIPGTKEGSTADAAVWAQTTLERLNGVAATATQRVQTASLLRPTPDTARLAYMLLANLGA